MTIPVPRPNAETLGARVVRRLGMTVPADPQGRFAQQVMAIVALAGAVLAGAMTATLVVLGDLDSADIRARLALNAFTAVMAVVVLLALVRRGRIEASAHVMAGVVLLYEVVCAVMIGLAKFPGVVIMAMTTVGAVATVTRSRVILLWVAAYGAGAMYGLLVTPIWDVPVATVPSAFAALFAITFFGLYVHELRDASRQQLAEIEVANGTLAASNVALQRALDERDRLAGQLERGQRFEVMGRVAGGIAHDFNNLLTVIRGYADILAEAVPADSPAGEDAQHLQQAVARASRVTADVLAFARPRAATRTRTDLGDFVRELSPALGTAAGADHPLVVQVGEGPLVASVDRGHVERVLVNLVLNARDASPAGAPVTVGVARVALPDGDVVRLAVIDRGPGIAPDDRERIFEPFNTSKGKHGTGLGLATCYALVLQHGGTLRVDDTPGGGTTFVVDLPADAGTARPIQVRERISTRTAGLPLDGLHALVVEDDPGVRAVTVRFLQQAGATVEVAEDRDAAGTALRTMADARTSLELVVSDLRLPGGTGAEVLAEARVTHPHASLVAMSGFLEDEAVTEMSQRGELVFLPKPFTASQLVGAVQRARAAVHGGGTP